MALRILFLVSAIILGAALVLLARNEIMGWAGGGEAHLRRGTRLLAEGAWEEAIPSLEVAVASVREDLRGGAHHNLGLACLQLALAEDGPDAAVWARRAVEEAEAALRLHPGFHGAAWNLEMALDRLRNLNAQEETAERGEARRLLVSFRLGEEARLTGNLRERMEASWGDPRSPESGGPWW